MMRFLRWVFATRPTDCPDCRALHETDPHGRCGQCWLDDQL